MNYFKDNDGYIEKRELGILVKELSLGKKFPDRVLEQILQEADVDGDGKISFAGKNKKKKFNFYLQFINFVVLTFKQKKIF